MKIQEILANLEYRFPLYLQEDFDNCGVQCGDVEQPITGALICFEISDKVIDEAIGMDANLVISHHPLMLKSGTFATVSHIIQSFLILLEAMSRQFKITDMGAQHKQ